MYYQIPMIGLSRPAGLIFGEILAGCSLVRSRGTLTRRLLFGLSGLFG
jgi:hypothetical protein